MMKNEGKKSERRLILYIEFDRVVYLIHETLRIYQIRFGWKLKIFIVGRSQVKKAF